MELGHSEFTINHLSAGFGPAESSCSWVASFLYLIAAIESPLPLWEKSLGAAQRVRGNMKKRHFFAVILPLMIFMGITIFLWSGLHHNPRIIPSPLLNKPAPNFRAPSLQNPDQVLSEQNFQGEVTILNVFATWCVSCQAEHSVWIEARRDLHNTRIIGLNYKDQRQKALAWLTTYGNPYDQIIDDPQGNIGINFGVYGTPETFIIDPHGIIRYKFIGAVTSADWQQTLLPEVNKWQRN